MKWYHYSYYVLLLLGVVVGSIKWKTQTKSLRILVWVLALTLTVELLARWMVIVYQNNLLIYAINRVLSFGLITYMFYQEIKFKWMIYSIGLFLIFHITNLMYIQPLGELFDSYSLTLSMIFTSIWSLIYLRRLVNYQEEMPLLSFPLFGVSCGILFFNSSTLLVFFLHNILAEEKYASIETVFRTIRIVSNHILYATYLASLLVNKLPKNKISSL